MYLGSLGSGVLMMVDGVVVTRWIGIFTDPPPETLFLEDVEEDELQLEDELDEDLEEDPDPVDDDELQLLQLDLYPSVEYDPLLEAVVALPPP